MLVSMVTTCTQMKICIHGVAHPSWDCATFKFEVSIYHRSLVIHSIRFKQGFKEFPLVVMVTYLTDLFHIE